MEPDSTDNASNATEGRLSRTAGGAHSAVDQAASRANGALDNVADKVKPMIGRVAESAHHAVDKAASLAEAPAQWLERKSGELRQSQEHVLHDAREYVMANPLKALGAALAAGVIIGRIMR